MTPVGTSRASAAGPADASPPPRTQTAPVLYPAGFWIRFVAAALDLAILVVPFCVFVSFTAVAMGISNPFFNHRAGTPLNETLRELGPAFLAVCSCFFAFQSWLYFSLSESSASRATLGKRLLGLYVAGESGAPVDFWRASLRFCAGRLLLHAPVLGLYYFAFDCLYVGLHPRKRALHDLFSGCRVLRESPVRRAIPQK